MIWISLRTEESIDYFLRRKRDKKNLNKYLHAEKCTRSVSGYTCAIVRLIAEDLVSFRVPCMYTIVCDIMNFYTELNPQTQREGQFASTIVHFAGTYDLWD